jgi:hypothetical protein
MASPTSSIESLKSAVQVGKLCVLDQVSIIFIFCFKAMFNILLKEGKKLNLKSIFNLSR